MRVAGETFCANCGQDFLPTMSDLGDTGRHATRHKACCANPRIVNLVDFLRPEEIAR